MRVTHACQEAEARVQMLQKSLKRGIVKSKPYFELKAQFNHILEVIQSQGVCETVSTYKTLRAFCCVSPFSPENIIQFHYVLRCAAVYCCN